MEKTIRVKFKRGVIEPLDKLELQEGEEVDEQKARLHNNTSVSPPPVMIRVFILPFQPI